MKHDVHPLRRLYRRWWWLVVSGLVVVSLILGFLGFREFFRQQGAARTDFDAFYLALQLFTLESGAVDGLVNTKLQIARFLAPAITVYAAALALFSIFHHEVLMLRLRFLQGHVIVCGLGRKGLRLVQSLLDRGERVVVIEPNESSDSLDFCRGRGVIVLSGSAADAWTLGQARVHKARLLLSVIGDDGLNVETAVLAHRLNKARSGQSVLRCLIHVADRGLQDIFKQHELFTEPNDPFDLEMFNVYETGARVILRELPTVRTVAAPRHTGNAPRLVIVGLGRLGEALLVRAIRDWVIDHTQEGDRLRVTVVDALAEQKRDWLNVRYPGLTHFADIAFLPLDVHARQFTQGQFLRTADGTLDVTAIYVCLNSDAISAYAAVTLHATLGGEPVPIIVRMSEGAGLATLLGGGPEHRTIAPGVQPIELLAMSCTLTQVLAGRHETLARAIHHGYLQQQLRDGITAASNPSVAPWDQLPEDLKESNRHQAAHSTELLAAIDCELVPCLDDIVPLLNFTDDEIEIMAQLEHERWCRERRASGWVWGEQKDADRKTNPHIVPWTKLPEAVQDYSRHAVRLIPQVFAKADYQVRHRARGSLPGSL